jgi:membrane fusion protein (multidrug efflux system)
MSTALRLMSRATEMPGTGQATSGVPISGKISSGVPRGRWLLLFSLLFVTVIGVLAYWHYRELYPTTDDAYARSGMSRIVSEVSGPVTHIYVRNDEYVSKDDPLFDIDPALYEMNLSKARAQFEDALSAAGSAGNILEKDAVQLDQKAHSLKGALRVYQDAKDAQKSDHPTSNKLITARKDWEGALAAFRAAEAKFDKDTGNLMATTPATLSLQTSADQLSKTVYLWFHTRVTAPASGWLAQMTLQPGAMVRAGMPLFALIRGGSWWVNANFKETELSRIKVGQKATISFDMYPNLVFDGVVDGISESSGSTFSMLPPENATGNWVKVTQRFPVQIRIINPHQYTNALLRMGASATVTVDTTSKVAS